MKKSKKTHKIKIVFFLIVLVVLIAIQINTFMPYTITETYISSQNVPHSVIVGRGWTGIDNIGFTYRDKGNESPDITTKQINIPVTVVQFLLTTAITAFVFFASDFKPGKNKAETDISKNQDTQPQSVVDKILSEDKEPISTNKKQEKTFTDCQGSPSDMPTLDINGLAFADEETQKAAMAKYADEMYHYIKRGLTFDEVSAATEDMLNNMQLTLDDVPLVSETVIINLLSPLSGHTKDTIEITDKNRDIINKWLDRETNSVYCFEVYRDGEPQYYYVKKEMFDALKKQFGEA